MINSAALHVQDNGSYATIPETGDGEYAEIEPEPEGTYNEIEMSASTFPF
jgi:hypothetical protein